MKKHFKMLAAAVLAAVLLSACGGNHADGTKATGEQTETDASEQTESSSDAMTESETDKATETETEPAAEPAVSAEDFLEEVVSEEGDYKDSVGNEYEYSYHIPHILSETAGAAAINEAIDKDYVSVYENEMQCIKQGTSLVTPRIRYESYQNGSLLSILLVAETEWENDIYGAYNYDPETGEQLDGKGLLARAGIAEDSFTAAARRAMAEAFDESYGIISFEDDRSAKLYYGDILSCRAQTLADSNCGTNNKIILGEKGMPVIAATLFTPAGSGKSYRLLPLGPAKAETSHLKKEVTYQTISAQIDGCGVYVTIGEPGGDYAYNTEGIKAGERQQVKGIYSDYKDIFIGNIGQEASPYLILTTFADTYEYINLLSAAQADFSCGSIPLPGLHDVKAFTQGTSGEQSGKTATIFAETGSGEKLDLAVWLRRASQSMPSWFSNYVWSTDTEQAKSGQPVCRLQFGSGSEFVFGEEASEGKAAVNYQGGLTLIGSSGDGLIYSFRLADEGSGNLKTGILSISSSLLLGDRMSARILAGTDLFGMGYGTEVALRGVRAYGLAASLFTM